MKRQKKSNLKIYLFLAAIVFAFLFAANYDVAAQNYKAGDRAECEVTGNPNGK